MILLTGFTEFVYKMHVFVSTWKFIKNKNVDGKPVLLRWIFVLTVASCYILGYSLRFIACVRKEKVNKFIKSETL